MMALRLSPLSNTERQAVISSLIAGVRLDGRGLLENRDVSVQFGRDFGCCTVSLGETRVLAQVSCEVVEPRPSRPNEGKIVTSVHITPMAGAEYEAGRTSDAQDELQQLLESNIRESRCLDVESLCILAEESVWQLRVDVTVLNACGNLGDACNMAAVAALKHFHRPDVTVEEMRAKVMDMKKTIEELEDGRVTIHPFTERAPIPTFLKKVPVCLTYAFCHPPITDQQGSDGDAGGELLVFTDPTALEERVVLGRLVVGLNPHGEITSMNFPGLVMLKKKHISFCISNAFQRARHCAELVDRLVEEDLNKRKADDRPPGFLGKLVSDQEAKKTSIDTKVTMMKMMTSQLRKVRDMVDSDILDKFTMKQEVDDDMAEYDELLQDDESDDTSSTSSSSDSEFSEIESTLVKPSVKVKEINKNAVLNSKVKGTTKKTCEKERMDSEDSEEDVIESVKVECL